ncbi:hypothetical protein ACFT7U_11960 [Streptomyces rochei]|uniref:hypothetical protein n=1 Tax=Streptomyces rochei TaxID=1928 RepID=UPI0013BDDB7C|nr:hypothetical protein [Streptomyces rochei]NEC72967.1 hypothetical protein [Streptomyces rochei]
MGAPFVQARLEVTSLGLGELAGASFVGERQGVLVAQTIQLGPQPVGLAGIVLEAGGF